ncbi:hypothetical protein ASG30_05560 [Ramlibacter sp. Leaf400]|nr:hypothetical protein ASG30_05560 [Ramlibacter sp. Leaf400]
MPAVLERTATADAASSKAGGGDRIHRAAGRLHKAIDSLEQGLTSKSRGVMSSQAKYGEQARQYGDKVRDQINARPLQAAGLAVGAGVILDRMFSRSPKVRVVNVPVRARPVWDADLHPERRANRWLHAAGSRMHGIGETGQEAMGKVGAAAALGLASTKAIASDLARTASTLPLQVRMGTQRLLARSHEYGSAARTGVQAHPYAGVGAFLGVGALLATVLMQRMRPQPGTTFVGADERDATAWQRDRYDVQPGYRETIASHPVASAAVVLGLGALVTALLARR